MMRYDMLLRAGKTMRRCGLRLVAFGLSNRQIRFVVEGNLEQIPNVVRGIKVGTLRSARARGIELVWGEVRRMPLQEEDLLDAVEWAHRGSLSAAGVGPLATPWTSHRDLLGFREAPFYDARILEGRICSRSLHENLGGRTVPKPSAIPEKRNRESLTELLRVSGGVLGVLPADRKCFRLFAHLARKRGWRNMDIAYALSLTTRRIRQLLSQPEPQLGLAYLTLADPRLCRVP